MTKARDLANASTALSAVSATELAYLDGVTSAVQTQVDAKIAKTLTTTTGDIIYASGANTPARLGIGSTAQVLTVAGGVPSWATPSAGGMTLISTTSLTGATVTLSSIPSTYKNLQLVIRGFRDNDDGNGGWVRMNADSTANRHVMGTTFGTVGNASWNNTRWDFNQNSSNAVATALYVLDIYDYANATTFKMGSVLGLAQHYSTTTNYNLYQYTGAYNQTTAISSLQIGPTGGTSITAGTAYLYGVN